MYEILAFRPYIKNEDGVLGKFKDLKEPLEVETLEETKEFAKVKQGYYSKKYPDSEVYCDLHLRYK